MTGGTSESGTPCTVAHCARCCHRSRRLHQQGHVQHLENIDITREAHHGRESIAFRPQRRPTDSAQAPQTPQQFLKPLSFSVPGRSAASNTRNSAMSRHSTKSKGLLGFRRGGVEATQG